MSAMNHASLFSGIGGFDLAADWMGWTNVFNCEWEDFPRKVLKYHFPNAIQYGDIREMDATEYRGRIDILTGGFPCQPYSTAGKRLGKEDERHLWPEMLRIICEVQPRYIVGENVRGLISWNEGLVFDEVQADMEAEGYEVLPFILPACAVNAPHRRDRVWFIAHSNERNDRRSTRKDERESRSEGIQERDAIREPFEPGEIQRVTAHASSANGLPEARRGWQEHEQNDGASVRRHFSANGTGGTITNTNYERWQRRQSRDETSKRPQPNDQQTERRNGLCQRNFENFPSQPPICGGNDGLSRELDGITFSKWRKESIKAYGNAIVPQVALQIFKAIEETEQ